ncbi:hypothetical protein BD626DRAFT_444118 [Schizophyllum amplum]|uniref:BTB domain-containing protein n=1 Tax=Schizophyllum amplum TaxID=97359 RepID=A0A550BSA5_9AGAR|nr:hypothetical protein BD626DRAFT_444118 [Auriculariopsis ampla]
MSENSTRVEDLWFDDGSIVLNVGNRLFCVHKTILALHSGFFRDMVASAEPYPSEAFEGMPLVTLHDDDPRDMTHFLKAVYLPGYFLPPPSRTSLEIIEGVLRLAHKYDVPQLRRHALQHLAIAYPTDLDKLSDAAALSTYIYCPDADMVGTVQVIATLARETEALWLLPSLYNDVLYNAPAAVQSETTFLGRQRRLSSEDVAACLAGCDAMCTVEYPFDAFFSSTLGCGEMFCTVRRLLYFGSGKLNDATGTPLTRDPDWFDDPSSSMDVCDMCAREMRAYYKQWRAGVWQSYPQYFKLPAWEELLRMKCRDLELPAPMSNGDAASQD